MNDELPADPEAEGWILITPSFVARQVEMAQHEHVDGQIARLWLLEAIRRGYVDPRSVPPALRPQAQLEDARRLRDRRRAEYNRSLAQLARPKAPARRRKAKVKVKA